MYSSTRRSSRNAPSAWNAYVSNNDGDGGDVAGKRWLYIVVQNIHVHTIDRLFTPPGTSRPGFRRRLSESKLEWWYRLWGYHCPDQH